MTSNEQEEGPPPLAEISPSPSAAPLLAAIEREIEERCRALDDLEAAWLDALLARSFDHARWLATRSKEHVEQIALARAELEEHGGAAADPYP